MDFVLLVPLTIIVLFAVINCAVRGFKRSIVRLIFVVVAAVIAFFTAPVVAGYLAKIEPFFNYSEGSILSKAVEFGPSLALAANGAPKAIWSVAVYPVLFLLLCIIMTIPVSIINHKIPKEKKGLGALFGIVVGIIGFTLALSPICTIGTVAMDTIPDKLIDKNDIQQLAEYVGVDVDVEKLLEQDKLMRIEGSIGELPLSLITTVSGNGKKVSLSKELFNLLPLYQMYDGDMTKLPQLLGAFAECSKNSTFINDVFSELQDTARQKWNNKEAFLGYDPNTPDESIMQLFAMEIMGSQQNLTVQQLYEKTKSLFESLH